MTDKVEVEMSTDEYMEWMKYRDFKRSTEDGRAEIEIVTAAIEDPGVIANIKFLWEKERAATFGAEQMFDKARHHHDSIWKLIEASLPDHFKDVETDKNGVKHLSKGKIYNHEENVLRYVLMKRVKSPLGEAVKKSIEESKEAIAKAQESLNKNKNDSEE